METPPRAWGRHFYNLTSLLYLGNTPTGVGKTDSGMIIANKQEKHPHGRGEDLNANVTAGGSVETPPRAWGRPVLLYFLSLSSGNTPTGVGKT